MRNEKSGRASHSPRWASLDLVMSSTAMVRVDVQEKGSVHNFSSKLVIELDKMWKEMQDRRHLA